MVGVGFVGAGRWAPVLAEAAGRARNIRIQGCCDTSLDAAQGFVAQYGGRAFESLDALLEDDSVEAVIVVTPNDQHAVAVEAAVARRKPVFVEKPVASTLKDAQRVRKLAAASGIPVSVGQCARRLKGIRRVRAMLESGELGDLVLVEGNYSTDRAWSLPLTHWRMDRNRNRGGPLVQLGVHHIDTFHYLSGPIVRVLACSKHLHAPAQIEDVVTVLGEFASGASSYLGSAWVTPEIFWVRVSGTKAAAAFTVDLRTWSRSEETDANSVLTVQRRGEDVRAVPLERGDMLAEELEEFAKVVQTGERPEVGIEEGMAVVAVIEAALRSASTERAEWVEREAVVTEDRQKSGLS